MAGAGTGAADVAAAWPATDVDMVTVGATGSAWGCGGRAYLGSVGIGSGCLPSSQASKILRAIGAAVLP